MTLGKAERQFDILDENQRFCEKQVGEHSIYTLLHRERDQLFPDELFADLFTDRGRRSVPPSIVACVMVLQKLGGCSDREAIDRFTFDLRWKYAAGVEGFTTGFDHTVLVNMRARLRASKDPERIFRVSKEVAADAGLIGVKRVLDSTPLYDAVATQDTVTLIRGAIRGLLRACDDALEAAIRRFLRRDDDYCRSGKPSCDWDDAEAREALVDDLVRDGLEALKELEHRRLSPEVAEAAALLATVIGQDIDQTGEGIFHIAHRTAPDRVISTVDDEARHGRKSSAHGFDGYKGHVAIDPDSEIVTGAEVGPANAGDAEMVAELIPEFMGGQPSPTDAETPEVQTNEADPAELESRIVAEIYGDSAYGSGANLALLGRIGATPMVKVQPPNAPGGRFTKDRFRIDLTAGTVTCPQAVTVALRPLKDGGGYASFNKHCIGCPLRQHCTTAKDGRVIVVSVHEALLEEARLRQSDPEWKARYRATRPKVERKLAHLMFHRHGGRRARVRGRLRVDQDFKLLAGAANLARLAVLGVRSSAGGWAVATA